MKIFMVDNKLSIRVQYPRISVILTPLMLFDVASSTDPIESYQSIWQDLMSPGVPLLGPCPVIYLSISSVRTLIEDLSIDCTIVKISS